MDKVDKVVRTKQVKTMFTSDELAAVSAQAGSIQIGKYLRMCALQSQPPAVPELNREAWLVLSKVAGNLATIAGAMRGGDYVEISDIREEISEFRAALLRARTRSKFIMPDDSDSDDQAGTPVSSNDPMDGQK